MKITTLVLCCVCSLGMMAQSVAHTSTAGIDTVPADFFRTWYHRSDMVYYLEALNDHVMVENTAVGQWWIPERLTMAVEGLPCTATRYYIDGFRVNDFFQTGSTQYVSNMQQYDLNINTHSGQLFFEQDAAAQDYVSATYNHGQLSNGEPALGTTDVFHLSPKGHRSPMESADIFKHVTARRHISNAGTMDAAYTFHDKYGRDYRQHIYASVGQRLITKEDQCGLITDDPLYDALYYKVQADGKIALPTNTAFDYLGYRVNFAGRADAGSEDFYNYNEVYDLKNYTGSIYGKRQFLTTGLTWSTNVTHHKDLNFRRNMIDQDGHSFEPWVADGSTHALQWLVNYEQPLFPWMSVFVDASNSLMMFRPETTTFSNTLYFQSINATEARDMYRYDWTSNAFNGGLMENTIGVKFHTPLCKPLDLSAHVDFTLDAMLLGHNKSKVSPNGQAGINLDLHPCNWFEMGLSVDYLRMPYTYDYLLFMSDDYMNADIHYADNNELKAQTGGRYHHYRKNLQQTTYLHIDLPVHFRIRGAKGGLHEVILQQSFRKYLNVWQVHADPNDPSQYEVGYTPKAGTNWFGNTPYYASQLTRYTYTGKKVTVGISWQSLMAVGYCGLGNGAISNAVGHLTETSADPNMTKIITNPKGAYPGFSCHDLDRGFACRFYLGYNICKWVQAGVTIKWTDGKPFTSYEYEEVNGGRDLVYHPISSRGTNPTDGNFGTRNCAKYNIDLHVQGQWEVNDIPMRLNVECYNMWDFCHDLTEMAFTQEFSPKDRISMIMDIPVGLLATFTVEFPK